MLVNRIAAAVMALVVITIAAGPSAATEFFVSTTGSDSAGGTTNTPWRTLQHAADAVGPGDRVTVRPGNYTGFDLRHSGTAAAPITFVAEPGVLINVASQVRQKEGVFQDGINLEGASYVVIDGFNIAGMPEAGVRSVGLPMNFAKFVTVRNVTATNNGYWGIFTGHVNDLLIENNRTSGSVNEHGIYVSNSGDRPVIRNNISFSNRGNGIHMNGDLSQGGDGIISGALVSGNTIYDNGLGGGSGINMDGVQNSRIENNLLYNNHSSGISLYKIDGAAGSSGNVVVNNTVHQASNGRWALNIQSGSTNNTARNNILLSDHSFRGAMDISSDSLTGFTSDYNAMISRFTTNGGNSVMTLAQWQAATGNDMHSLVANASALFVNTAGGDYHLKNTSPALNVGTMTSAPPADLAGLPRPASGLYDIGAYEFGALAGDYTRDGKVDSSDYTLWRKTLGTAVTRFAGADGDGSGVIDQADYTKWRSGFGGPIPAAGAGWEPGAVPEPLSMSLLFLVSWALCAATKR